jgi:uncharacterized Rmd1/YagE family protein
VTPTLIWKTYPQGYIGAWLPTGRFYKIADGVLEVQQRAQVLETHRGTEDELKALAENIHAREMSAASCD